MEELVSMEVRQVPEETEMVNRKEAGPASGQPAGIATEEVAEERLNIIIDRKVGSRTSPTMEEKFASLENAIKKTTRSPKPLIQRVPYMLRDHKNFKKYYEPKVMAIGPLHHGKSYLQPAEQHKLRLAALFVKKIGLDTEVLYNKIWTEIRALRECFDQEETKSFTDEQLAWMLFVDGCAVLHLINSRLGNSLAKELEITVNQLVLIASQDLFLLENPIPFRVIELLTSLDSDMKEQWLCGIKTFIAIASISSKVAILEDIGQKDQRPIHLLLQMHVPNSRPIYSFRDDIRFTFRNVKQDLKSAGIRLERIKTRFLTDISFTSRCFGGKLNLPSIIVDRSTGTKFMNLIAYEMCPAYDNDFVVNSYVWFLHSLVDKAEDAMEFRRSDILINFLGSDEEVVNLFNDISTHLAPNPVMYFGVQMDIEKHYNSKWKTWMAQARQDYFSSPWSVIALVGAVVALVLTAIQTWFTVSSSK